jgi:hypothetical protein
VIRIFTRLLPQLFLFAFFIDAAASQQNPPLPRLDLGDAVVTGFSGTLTPAAGKPRPAGKSAVDVTFINPDGPSARIVALGKPGFVWDGRLIPANKTFDVLAKDVGQVFGVALDDQSPPNIYLAATSAFGLNLVRRGRDGTPERVKKGGPGVGWMRGQVGLDLQGGPGAIYKVDGKTGAVTLFANVTLEGVPNPGPGLGNLAYDAAHKQLFVSDLYTGMIHRFDLDGRDLGYYDHGDAGLAAAKLARVAFNPRNRPNIATDRFDSEKPETWGYAPAARRVWGLAVHEGRLYYSVAAGPQIWSVGIERDGGFAADPRWELDVPAQSGPLPVSDIAFSQQGAMLLAQRALVAGSYDYSAFVQPGEPQVFRLWLKGPNDPPSPGRWKPVPEEYAIGFAGNYRNSNGGIALGYGYGQDGVLSTAACEFSLWATGQNLRNSATLKERLEPGGPLVVHGLQGMPASPVRAFNEPPWTSYFADYIDTQVDPRMLGHLGGVRILTKPCPPPAVYGGPGHSASPPYTYTGTPVTIVTDPGCVGTNCPPPPPPFDIGIKKISESNPNNPNGPYNFTVGVTNLAGPINNPTTLTFTDVVPPGMTFTNITSSNWTCGPNVPPALPAGGTLTCTYTGSFPIATSQPLGWVTIVATGGSGPFENCASLGTQDADPSNDKACVTVKSDDNGYMRVEKIIQNDANAPLNVLQTIVFPATVTCGSNTTQVNVQLTSPGIVHNVPVGTLCTVAETLPPPPAGICPQGQIASWGTPSYVPPSVTITSGAGPVITMKNTLSCVKDGGGGDGSLSVTKQVINKTDPQVPTTGMTFAIHASCQSGMSPAVVTDMSLPDGGSQTVGNLALGTNCQVTEDPPGPPPPWAYACLKSGDVLTWSTAIVPSGPVTITGPNTPVTVQNTLECKPSGGGDGGSLVVTKTVVNNTGGLVNTNGLTYPATVTCGGTTNSLTLTANAPQTIGNITLGTSCSVQEGALVTPSGCPTDFLPVWSTTITPASPVPVNGPNTPVTVQNTLDCKLIPSGKGYLLVQKVINNPNNIPITGLTFPATASCGGTDTPLTLSTLGAQVVNNLSPGTICSVTETLPPPPTSGCIGGPTPHWSNSPAYSPPSVSITGGSPATITVTNTLICSANIAPPPKCKTPMIPGAAPGQCVCPSGTVQKGNECVTQSACKAPMVPGAAPGQCVCPPGTVQKGGKCVEQAACRSPMKPNKNGDCVCPDGMTKKGNRCLDQDKPRSRTDDVIRVVPGILGGFGRGGGGGSGGGGGGGSSGGGGGGKGGGGYKGP